MKKILVPIDFSEVSENALNYAIKLAKPLNSKIILFHTIRPILIANDMGEYVYPEESEDENYRELNGNLYKLMEYVKDYDVPAEKVIRKGAEIDEEIAEYVEKEKIDMVITGTHGAKGLEAFLFGTNSVHIFEKVKCPVLIIPATARFQGIKTIMYATDFQYGDIHEIEKICKLAQPFNAQIIVTHINKDLKKFEEEEETMDWFAEIGSTNIHYKNIVYKLIYHEKVVEALDNAVTVLDVDILCMSTLEKDFFRRIVSKGTAREMAYHTKTPLLSLHLTRGNKL